MNDELAKVEGGEIAALLIPTTVTLVTARGRDGADKVATVAWAMPISHEPSLMAVALRPQGQTARAMADAGCFAINVLGAGSKSVSIATTCGRKQGVSDRIAEAGLDLAEGLEVTAPRIRQAISWIECELVERHACGDHDLFIGRTVSATTRGTLDESGRLVPLAPLLMSQRSRFGHFEEGFGL